MEYLITCTGLVNLPQQPIISCAASEEKRKIYPVKVTVYTGNVTCLLIELSPHLCGKRRRHAKRSRFRHKNATHFQQLLLNSLGRNSSFPCPLNMATSPPPSTNTHVRLRSLFVGFWPPLCACLYNDDLLRKKKKSKKENRINE